eukprot:TRINITY_DN1695_c0_g2_i2.p1 TRINITY_DN1695_c0_g2~~TRINITY_DN1695_c0_g2_i2.p1  ORF type:complete len:192 (-),score=45.25 TRINITY_DN1695_c0_g2_i2:236-811(-)
MCIRDSYNTVTHETCQEDPRCTRDREAARLYQISSAEHRAAPKQHEVVDVAPQKLSDGRLYCPACEAEVSADWETHRSSIGHQMAINMVKAPVKAYGLGPSNKGYQMLKNSMGWTEDQGLGARNQGQLDPVKTVLRRKNAGLGTEVSKSAVTHKNPFLPKNVQQQAMSKKASIAKLKGEKRKRKEIWESLQ